MLKKQESATRGHGGLRGLKFVNGSSISGGRFGRMFRWLPGETYEKKDLESLAKQMIQLESAKLRTGPRKAEDEFFSEGPEILFNTDLKPGELLDTAFGKSEAGDENPTIPAGYTYFGQFIDHDLTFDPNSSLQKQNDPDALEDFRTPRFDLDSVYGRGPDDQPYLYDNGPGGDGFHFLLGRDGANLRRGELPRNVDGRALIGDPRNDENVLVSQLQAVFLNFHNKVFDTLKVAARPEGKAHDIFLEAQRIVRWHYQYLILHDFLPRIVGQGMADRVLKGGALGQPLLQFYKPKLGQAYMPVEFSVAAFRFGHSMVRPSYALRPNEEAVGGSSKTPFSGDPKRRFHRIPVFSDERAPGANLSGFGPLLPGWEINWNLFFSESDLPVRPAAEGPDKGVLEVFNTSTQPGYRIDTKLVDPLAMLPPNVAKSGNMADGIPVLAYRNLLRGSEFSLPSGQSVATALGFIPLTHEQLWSDVGAPGEQTFRDPKQNPFTFRAPLWFYILREAEVRKKRGLEHDKKGGHHLGDVGGRIVAEVLVGIAQSDHTSYLYQDSTWTPDKEKAKSGFDPGGASLKTMFELIKWTTDRKMTFLP